MTDDRNRMTAAGRGRTDGGGQPPAAGDSAATMLRYKSSDYWVAAACGGFVAMMIGAAYAAVPLYTWFCRTTGFGGTPQIVEAAPGQISDRRLTVRFDANVGPGLPWHFEPERNAVELRLGEVVTVYYTVTNLSDRDTLAQAAYNVTPTTVGGYFDK